jgi:carbon-monoxide dehydrogenase small subunit
MSDEEKATVEQVEETEGQPLKVSRRDFLIGAGAGVVATGALAGGYIALAPREPAKVAEGQAEVAPAPEVAVSEAPAQVESVEQLPATVRAVTLNIDGKSYDVVVDVRESLWETMTDTLGLGTSINIGCDRAQCGACAVVVDGRAVNGCTILSARLGRGQEILTISSLNKGTRPEDLHPIARAYWQEGGFQCGVCTRGFIMSTYALLSQNLNPTEDDIREALAGNICRCAEYPKIYDSVLKAAEEMRA